LVCCTRINLATLAMTTMSRNQRTVFETCFWAYRKKSRFAITYAGIVVVNSRNQSDDLDLQRRRCNFLQRHG
jgi:hypothetical protein